MAQPDQHSPKALVVSKKDSSPKYWMSKGEYTNIIVSAKQSNNEYVISDGIIEPDGFVPAHYHKWEDQTFHVMEGTVTAIIDGKTYTLTQGDTIHCPRGISHYIKNNGSTTARLVSYIFPGTWAEAFFEATAKQNESGQIDFEFIEAQFGVVYT